LRDPIQATHRKLDRLSEWSTLRKSFLTSSASRGYNGSPISPHTRPEKKKQETQCNCESLTNTLWGFAEKKSEYFEISYDLRTGRKQTETKRETI
jgi:hypothetical protein